MIEALDAFETPAGDLEDGADDELTGDDEPSLSFTNDLNQEREGARYQRASRKLRPRAGRGSEDGGDSEPSDIALEVLS